MQIKVNCIHTYNDAWCKNKNVSRSLFGLGARVCSEYCGKKCEYKEKYKLSVVPPAPQTINYKNK